MKRQSDLQNARIRLLVVLLAALALVAYNVFTYSASREQDLAYWDMRLSNGPSVREYYLQAVLLARQWRQDAQLVSAEVQFYPPQRDQQPWVSLVFRDTHSLYASLIITYVDRQLEMEEVTRTTPWQVAAIEPAEWTLDSTDALEIAQNNGGTAFISEHPHAEVWVQLGRYGPTNGAWWLVHYIDFAAGKDLLIAIDAASGVMGYRGGISTFQDWRLGGSQ